MIDRSKPLPIHEFPSLIDGVARLKDLGAKATPGECIAIEDDDRSGDFLLIQNNEHWAWKDGSNSPDAKYIAALRNAAPKLLDVLSEIRAGDAEIIGLFVEFMEKHKPDGHLNDTGPGAKITNAKATACLRRYRDIARKMEENR